MFTEWSGSKDSPIWIQPRWPSHLVRGLFSFRTHGVSRGPFNSLNVGLHVNDDVEDVLTNRRKCALQIGGHIEDFVVGDQVHGANVAAIDASQKGRGAMSTDSAIPNTDALVTNVPGVTLSVMVADCVPVLFFDSVKRVIATAHSGWKGTVQHISRRVIDTMSHEYGSAPEDIDVWLGPSIRRCCYEVGGVVVEPVTNEFGRSHMIARFGKPGRVLLSLQSCIVEDLFSAGVQPSHIHDVGVCTACHHDVLFSHRSDAGKTGRLMGAVRLL